MTNVQLRYYHDGSQEDNPKDVIELKDVLAVAPMKSVPGAVKKADDNAFFEVRHSCDLLQKLVCRVDQYWLTVNHSDSDLLAS